MVYLRHAFYPLSPADWTFSWRRLVAVLIVVVPMSLVNVGNARRLHTFLGCLLVKILERILVKVNGRRAVVLWSSLLKSTTTHLVINAFKSSPNLLSR